MAQERKKDTAKAVRRDDETPKGEGQISGRSRAPQYVFGALLVGAAGCSAEVKKQAPVPVVSVDTSSASAAVTATANETPPNEPLVALMKTKSWARLREIWQSMLPQGSTDQQLPWEQVQKLRIDAHKLLSELRQSPEAKSLDPSLLKAWEQLFNARFEYESGLPMRVMTMHRAPSPWEQITASGVGHLEKQLSALYELKRQGSIGSKEYQTTLSAVAERLRYLAIIDRANAARFGFSHITKPTIAKLEKSLEAQKSRYEDAGTTPPDFSQLYEKIRTTIADAKRTAPLFKRMVADIER